MAGTATINSYQDLIAWQKALQLGLDIYQLTGTLPDHERFGLISQLRRGAISVASNIAEGYGRGSKADYLRFLKIVRGALYELDTQLLYTLQLTYITQDTYKGVKEQLDEGERVLAGLIRSLG